MAASNSTAAEWMSKLVSSTVSSTAFSASRHVPNLSPAQWIQVFYIVATGLVLGVAVLPRRARAYLLTYGARALTASEGASSSVSGQEGTNEPYRDEAQDGDGTAEGEHVHEGDAGEATENSPEELAEGGEDAQNSEGVQGSQTAPDDWFTNFVNIVTSWGQVPHSWFGGFYAVSLACSVFWLIQYLIDGRILHFLATRQAAAQAPGMEPGQVSLLWTMMFLQGARRFVESAWLFTPGKKSTMWIVHWLLGNVYYIMMSMTVWIEGSEAILQRRLPSDLTGLVSPKTVVGTLGYLYAAASQYHCHKHLAGLVKYSLPTRGAFRFLICPHYFFESLLYFSMAVAGAPEGALCNRTLLCGFLFVVTNLSVTAAGTTRKWYEGKFGADAVKKRWNIIPLLY